MKRYLNFLKPRLFNTLLAIAIFSLPLIRERSRLPDGTITEVVYYRPIYLLATYLQVQDWQPFFLMVGFLLVIYLVASLLVAIVAPVWKKITKSKR